MGAFYTNVLLRGVTCEQTLCALRKLRRRAFVASGGRGATVVYDSKCEQQDTKFLCDLSAALSRELQCAAWGILNHDDDVLWYALFSNGEIVDSYNSAPDFFEDSNDPAPPEGGDGEVLSRLMGQRKSAAKIKRILHAADEKYEFASDRHRDLCNALRIDFSRVSCGFDDIESGRRHLTGLIRVGASPTLPRSVQKRAHARPIGGSIGVVRPIWYRIADLEVTSGVIEIADLGSILNDSFSLRVVPGKYQIEARLIDFDRCAKVSRVRAVLAGAEFNRGKCGEVSLDFAGVAVGDFESVRKNLNDQQQENLNKWALRAIGTTVCSKRSKRIGTHVVSMVLCRAALGDGTYPIFRINQRGRAVGFEVEFIPDGQVWRLLRPSVKWARVRNGKITPN